MTGGAAATGTGMFCFNVGKVTMLPVMACGAGICSTWPGCDSTMGRPEKKTQKTTLNYRTMLT